MRLALILCTLSAAVCLVSGLGQPEAPTKASSYPKKVTTLKKRPTKTPTAATTATSSSSSISAGGSGTTSKPSKPRVKIGKTSRPTTPVSRGTTKAPALAASFGNLPADDLEFIKELDKQFKLHGDKIKIKVERDNSTGTGGKNSKRTIEGELGYGYAHQGYDYTPPKFMFYPYSQHDIPATEAPLDTYGSYAPSGFAHPQPEQEQEPEEPQEHQQAPPPQQQQHVTSVTIEPSYSYELKPQTTYETQAPHPTQPQEHQPHPSHGLEQPQIDLPQDEAEHGDQGGYQEPVIVLRIPGPAKYAAHLQTLLQQYLEIRAAQYLSLLQEAEQQQQQQQQHHQQQQPQQQHVDISQQYGAPEQGPYHPDVTYAHQLAPTPQPVQYAAIDDVYQSYKGRHQQQQQVQHQQVQHQQVQQYEQPPPEAYYAPTGYQQQTQFYYAQPQSHGHVQQGQAQPQLYLIAMAPQPDYGEAAPQADYAEPQQLSQQQQHQSQQQQQQPIYVPESEPPTAPEAEHEQEHSLPITENNPRPTHTKVIFNSHPSHMYPALRQYSQQQQQQQQQQLQLQHQQVDQLEQQEGASEESAPSGQRPYNYHAHGLKMRQGKRSAKAQPEATPAGDERLQQIREYVREKLGAEMGSAVEYKTTQLLEG